MDETKSIEQPARLMRSLTLGHAILYGLGVTIGAGIYVLIGAAAGIASYLTPLSFVIAALILAPTAASIGELASRLPLAAGEAAYARAGFRSEAAALTVGLMTAAIAIISGGAIAVGSAGYIAIFLPMSEAIIIASVVIGMGLVAAWGIRESVTLAGLMTLIEIGGLVLIIAVGFGGGSALTLPEMKAQSAPEGVALMSVLFASMLAVFAFVGFEALANVAEEVVEPERNLPLAIYATLAITTGLYVLVVWVALTSVGAEALSQSKAPLALVFQKLTGWPPLTMSAIAVVATLNGIIVQIIMASRVFYGLSRQGNLPRFLGQVHPVTRTPVVATSVTTAIVLFLALAVPLADLALFSSRLLLGLFVLINGALILIKARETRVPDGIYSVAGWVPWAGLASTTGFLLVDGLGAIAGR